MNRFTEMEYLPTGGGVSYEPLDVWDEVRKFAALLVIGALVVIACVLAAPVPQV